MYFYISHYVYKYVNVLQSVPWTARDILNRLGNSRHSIHDMVLKYLFYDGIFLNPCLICFVEWYKNVAIRFAFVECDAYFDGYSYVNGLYHGKSYHHYPSVYLWYTIKESILAVCISNHILKRRFYVPKQVHCCLNADEITPQDTRKETGNYTR